MNACTLSGIPASQCASFPLIRAAVENLEAYAGRAGDDFRGGLRALREQKEREARLAGLPPITAEPAAVIRRIIQETKADEARLLKLLGAPTVEEIKDFDRVVSILEQRRAGPPA
jgi:hypothetical protein